MANPKQHSGINRGGGSMSMSQLRNAAKTGTMPYVSGTYTVANFEKAFEAIDKYYAEPDYRLLQSQGVGNLLGGWHTTSYNGELRMYREYYISTSNGGIARSSVPAPVGASKSAYRGAEKYALYHLLSKAGKLDKSQFVKKE